MQQVRDKAAQMHKRLVKAAAIRQNLRARVHHEVTRARVVWIGAAQGWQPVSVDGATAVRTSQE